MFTHQRECKILEGLLESHKKFITAVKAHAFGDLNELKWEAQATLPPPHWGAANCEVWKRNSVSTHSSRSTWSLGSSPPHSDTQLIPNRVSPHLWELPTTVPWKIMDDRHGLSWTGQTLTPQGQVRLGPQPLSSPSSPWSWHVDFHPLHSPAAPRPTVTSDHVVTECRISSAFICPKFLLHVLTERWVFKLLPPASRLSPRTSSSSCPEMGGPLTGVRSVEARLHTRLKKRFNKILS